MGAEAPVASVAQSRPPTSPAEIECLDSFSPAPGDSDVINQVDRLSSSEIKIAPRSVRMALWSCSWWSSIGQAPAGGGYSDLTLPAAERSATPPHGIFSS
jgi:hypothetical protein